MPGISTHTELKLLVRLGLTPREALAAATSNYCERLGWCELGLVASGRRADLLILAADPTTDITHSRKIRSVVLDGEVIDRQELLSGVGLEKHGVSHHHILARLSGLRYSLSSGLTL